MRRHPWSAAEGSLASLVVMVVVAVGACPAASAKPPTTGHGHLAPAGQRLGSLTGGQLIGEETRLLLELPTAENPIAGNGESCFQAGHNGKVLIVWTRDATQAPAVCTVKPGTS